ncbi:hypothetical protein Bca4012_004613 [Brassica carinata]
MGLGFQVSGETFPVEFVDLNSVQSARKHLIIKSYARPFRLLPAEEVKVSTANPSFTIEAAFDVFYSQAQPKSNGDMRRLEELFSRYKGNMLFLMCFTVSHSPRYCHVGQELGLYKAQVMLPFNAFGTMAMAREVRVLSLLSFLHN